MADKKKAIFKGSFKVVAKVDAKKKEPLATPAAPDLKSSPLQKEEPKEEAEAKTPPKQAPDTKAETKPEAKPEAKPETKADTKPEAKPAPEPPAKKPPPVITKLRPSGGPPAGGTRVTIEGTGFVTGCEAKIDRVSVKSTFVSSTELVFTTLPRSLAGRVDVEVVNPDKQRALTVLGYDYCLPPELTSIDPDHGPETGGARSVLTGANLYEGIEVRIGATRPRIVEYREPTQVVIEIPAHPSGNYDVEVVSAEGQKARLEAAFRFDKPPRLDRVTPDHGPFAARTPIVLEGEYFRFGCAVYLGGQLVPSEFQSSSRIVTFAPPHDGEGPVSLRIINVDGLDVEKAEGFRYDPPLPPRVVGIEPSRLARAREHKAVVTGEGFAEGCSVRIAGEIVPARYVSDTRLDVTVPPLECVGLVDVEVENLDLKSHRLENALDLRGPPELRALLPREGSTAGGDVLTLNGLWFDQGCQVTVGGIAAKTTWESETTLRVVAPPRGAAGVVDAVVTNVDGQDAALTEIYTYVAQQPPVIASLEPTSGPAIGGTRVVIRGERLDEVTMLLIGGTPAIGLKGNATELAFVTPPIGRDGGANVELRARGGVSVLRKNAFQYTPVPPPAIRSVSPNRVAVGGGTEVTITGENFVAGATVLVDREPVASSKVRDKATIVFKAPPGKEGAMADVAVRSPTGQEAVAKRAFLYNPRYR